MIQRIEHILTPFIRHREIQQDKGDFLYELYLMLRRAPASMTKDSKQRTFEAAAVGPHHWEVVAISKDALTELNSGKGQPAVRRGHPFGRDDRFLELFGPRSEVVARDELLQFYYEHDATALVSKTENEKPGTDHWSTLYPVEENLFSAAGYGVKLRVRTEMLWIRRLHREIETVGTEPKT